MTLGIRLLFRRDLGYQFSGYYTTAVDAGYTNEHVQVFGSMDYLKCELLHDLAEVITSPYEASRARQLPPKTGVAHDESGVVGGANDIILFPLPEEGPLSADLGETAITGDPLGEYVEKCQRSINESDLLCVTRLSLSSLTFDYCKTLSNVTSVFDHAATAFYSAVKTAQKQFRTRLRTNAPAVPEITLWLTLGGPDLVCIALPQTAAQLAYVNLLTNVLRGQPISSLLTKIRPSDAQWEGHAFASVQSNLCYRDTEKLTATIQGPAYRKREEFLGLRYPCRISVGPGHELQILGRIEAALEKQSKKYNRPQPTPHDTACNVCCGHRSIQITFNHFSDLVTAVRESMTPLDHVTQKRIRAPEVTAVRSTVAWDRMKIKSLPTDYMHNRRSPKLSKSLSDLLRDIRTGLNSFADTWLGDAHGHALMQLYETFAAAFRRNDRATGVRDLLPFFDQLSRALTPKPPEDPWPAFYASCPTEVVASDFGTLFAHLLAAIRNRVEQRGEPVDPSFPNTIEYGASKIVNAYSVASWMACNALLNGITRPLDKDDCARERFAVAVRAGSEGAVRVTNLFAGLLDDTDEPITTSEDEEWNAPLLLFSISGPVLLRPELAFAMCIHEMAEVSNWSRLPHARHVNKAVNQAMFDAFFAILSVEIGELYAAAYQNDEAAERDAKMLNALIFVRMARHTGEPILSYDEMESREEIAQETRNIASYFNDLVASFHSIEPEDIHEAIECLDATQPGRSLWPPWGQVTVDKSGKIYSQLQESAKDISPQLQEVVADLAMCLTLKHLLEVDTDKAMLGHINHLFCGILETSVSWSRPSLQRDVDGIITRWAFQLACFASDTKMPSIQLEVEQQLGLLSDRITLALQSVDKSIPKFDSSVWINTAGHWDGQYFLFSKSGLAAAMRECLKRPLQLWDFKSHDVGKIIIKEFRDLWNLRMKSSEESVALNRKRFDFILKMWAKAQLFRVDTLFA